jgi:hypothetical protein
LSQGQQVVVERRPGVLGSSVHARFHLPSASADVRLIAYLHEAVGTVSGAAE